MGIFTIIAGLAIICSSSSAAALAEKKRLIIDTDMINFDDDPLAIGLANIMQDWKEVELIGVMSSILTYPFSITYTICVSRGSRILTRR